MDQTAGSSGTLTVWWDARETCLARESLPCLEHVNTDPFPPSPSSPNIVEQLGVEAADMGGKMPKVRSIIVFLIPAPQQAS